MKDVDMSQKKQRSALTMWLFCESDRVLSNI